MTVVDAEELGKLFDWVERVSDNVELSISLKHVPALIQIFVPVWADLLLKLRHKDRIVRRLFRYLGSDNTEEPLYIDALAVTLSRFLRGKISDKWTGTIYTIMRELLNALACCLIADEDDSRHLNFAQLVIALELMLLLYLPHAEDCELFARLVFDKLGKSIDSLLGVDAIAGVVIEQPLLLEHYDIGFSLV